MQEAVFGADLSGNLDKILIHLNIQLGLSWRLKIARELPSAKADTGKLSTKLGSRGRLSAGAIPTGGMGDGHHREEVKAWGQVRFPRLGRK